MIPRSRAVLRTAARDAYESCRAVHERLPCAGVPRTPAPNVLPAGAADVCRGIRAVASADAALLKSRKHPRRGMDNALRQKNASRRDPLLPEEGVQPKERVRRSIRHDAAGSIVAPVPVESPARSTD